MSYEEWKDRIDSFKKVDVRGIQGNFFQGLKKQAMDLPAGEGMEVIQSFEPIPLYEVMEGLGYERHTEKKGDTEFHAYFYRCEIKTELSLPFRCSSALFGRCLGLFLGYQLFHARYHFLIVNPVIAPLIH